MRTLLFIACLFGAHSLFGYTYTGNYCCNSTDSGFNTTTCSGGGSSTPAGSIGCSVTVAANQTVFVWGFYGIAFTPTPTPTSTCGITWSPGGRGSGGIDGIATYPWADVGDTGAFAGACTITMAPTNGPDFMYIMALVYDLGATPIQDPAGVLVGDSISGATSTDIATYPPTSYSNEAVFCVHGWQGQLPSSETLSGGAGETVRFNVPLTFQITVLGTTHFLGIIVEDFLTGPPSSYNSVAHADIPVTGAWLQVMIPVKTPASVAVQGEKRRRTIN